MLNFQCPTKFMHRDKTQLRLTLRSQKHQIQAMQKMHIYSLAVLPEGTRKKDVAVEHDRKNIFFARVTEHLRDNSFTPVCQRLCTNV